MKPIIAIVGKPNVGKSTLFNRLSGGRDAIVDRTPGITRDRIWGGGRWGELEFNIIDTAGFDDEKSEIFDKIREQIEIAIEEADILFVLFDGRNELTELDFKIVEILRKKKKERYHIANKIDSPSNTFFHLFELGIDKFYPISAEHGHGIDDIFLDIFKNYKGSFQTEEDHVLIPKIAIVGKPNVGKSSLLNQLTGKRRAIVDSEPGTTRDSIHTIITVNSKKYLLVDTAGIRKKKGVNLYVDKISMIKSFKSIERSDISILVIDGMDGIGILDAKIGDYIKDCGKGAILAVNKKDLLSKERIEAIRNGISDRLKFIDWVPVILISALTGDGVSRIIEEADKILKWRGYKIKTNELNNFLKLVIQRKNLSPNIKFKYISQVSAKPPTFVIKTNHPDKVQASYKRYIANSIRKRYTFYGNPIFLTFKE